MNKSELVDALAAGSDISKATALKVLDVFMQTITETLQKADQIVLTGFGSFKVSNRAARTGRNPKTGEEIEIKASRVIKFTAGKTLKDSIKES